MHRLACGLGATPELSASIWQLTPIKRLLFSLAGRQTAVGKQACCRALTFEEAGDQFVHDVLQSLVRPGWRLTNVTGAFNIYAGGQGKGRGRQEHTAPDKEAFAVHNTCIIGVQICGKWNYLH